MNHRKHPANKRLIIENFQAKQGNKEEQQTIEPLLGQVWGDCHDSKKTQLNYWFRKP